MKRILCLTGLGFALAAWCSGAPCMSGSLTSYIALGASGCSIGGTTLSHFQDLAGASFDTEISSNAITIAPSGGTYNAGVSASVKASAPAGTILEMMFTYTISGPTYVSENITLSGASESGGGAVYEAQNYCENGTFGPDGVDGCTGMFNGSLATADGFSNIDSATFDPPSFLNVTEDLFIDGTFGSASGGAITDQFTAVPEPGALMITIVGFAFLIVCKSRFWTATRSRNQGAHI